VKRVAVRDERGLGRYDQRWVQVQLLVSSGAAGSGQVDVDDGALLRGAGIGIAGLELHPEGPFRQQLPLHRHDEGVRVGITVAAVHRVRYHQVSVQ
jgi:hypothetical protein